MSGDLVRGPALESDRPAVQVFECTRKPERVEQDGRWVKVHDRQYELVVQTKIRRLRPPLGLPNRMNVVRDVSGLAGVAIFEELDGPGEVELHFIAVALRCRRPGGSGLGRILMQDVLDAITARAVEEQVNEVFVSTLIHRKTNQA